MIDPRILLITVVAEESPVRESQMVELVSVGDLAVEKRGVHAHVRENGIVGGRIENPAFCSRRGPIKHRERRNQSGALAGC
jgi:hypothetical protein